jgi:hypothetical protein
MEVGSLRFQVAHIQKIRIPAGGRAGRLFILVLTSISGFLAKPETAPLGDEYFYLIEAQFRLPHDRK